MLSLRINLQAISYQSRHDTEIAIRDGKSMKVMALVTMFFLPGTFFAVGQFT